jgi:hypothetical protein
MQDHHRRLILLSAFVNKKERISNQSMRWNAKVEPTKVEPTKVEPTKVEHIE